MQSANNNKRKRKDTNGGSTGLRIYVYINRRSLAKLSALAA
jgi:hypothetical protein